MKTPYIIYQITLMPTSLN